MGVIVEDWRVEARKLVRGETSSLTLPKQWALTKANFHWGTYPVIKQNEVFESDTPPSHKSKRSETIVPNGLELEVANTILNRCGVEFASKDNSKYLVRFQEMVAYRMRQGNYMASKKEHPQLGEHFEN